MRVVIIDDEKYSINNLKKIMVEYENIAEVITFMSPLEGLSYLLSHAADLVFLDIEMPQINGIYIAEQISKIHPQTHICFVTAFSSYTIKAFELNAIDYILKPFTPQRVLDTLDHLQSISAKPNNFEYISESRNYTLDVVCAFKGEEIVLLKKRDIVYLEYSARKTYIHTYDDVYISKNTLTYYEQKLESKMFFRCHKGYIINLKEVASIMPRANYTYDLSLKGTEQLIPLSRSKVKEIKSKFNM